MFAMKQYPHDIYPLYAQGYSLARFLIMQGGRQHFINYVGAGMTTEQPGLEPRAWDAATKKFYGYGDLSELQVRWVQWVKQGCPDLTKPQATQIASRESAPNQRAQVAERSPNSPSNSNVKTVAAQSWYVSQSSAESAGTLVPVSRQVEPAANPDKGDIYRPGSIREGRPIEILATVSPTNVSANRINPEYFARPEIQPANRSAPTIWR
jgi:hypothetical protein